MTARKLVQNLGPNEVCIYAVPGKGSRVIIDTRYEIDALVDGEWATVGRYGRGQRAKAEAFAQGYMRGERAGRTAQEATP